MFFIHLIVNYRVNHPRFHVVIIVLLKKHHILIENEVPAIWSEFIDKMHNLPPPTQKLEYVKLRANNII